MATMDCENSEPDTLNGLNLDDEAKVDDPEYLAKDPEFNPADYHTDYDGTDTSEEGSTPGYDSDQTIASYTSDIEYY